MIKYKRTLEELEENAVLYWPDEIIEEALESSPLPLLLKTQDHFISVLKLATKDKFAWKEIINQTTNLTYNLFLKHLMILSDLGGEALNKLTPIASFFPDGIMEFVFNSQDCSYKFIEIYKKTSLTNSALRVDSKKLRNNIELNNKMQDVIMLLLFGGSATNDTLPTEVKASCEIGAMIGIPDKIDEYIKRNYLLVSKQTSGAKSNEYGQLTQNYVIKYLKKYLPENEGWKVSRDKTLPNVSHNIEGSGTNFDIVVKSPKNKYFGIEVSFQFTTNSVIERKSRESESLMNNVHGAGHKICYVIDGAGNINIRRNAVGIICHNSDCTVAMSTKEIEFLSEFILSSNNNQ